VIYQNFADHDQSGDPSGDEDQITLARAVVYLGYKFDRHFVLNTEIEYENAVVGSDKGGEVEVEFAYIDYMNRPEFNARAGLVLIPMGLVNEQHEPTAFSACAVRTSRTSSSRRPGASSGSACTEKRGRSRIAATWSTG
jgi:hypothetical protein